ncbi:hypothetical protein ACTMTU_14120 [Streptomyces sp. OZ13]|uniref:hypothetical protein n=1 Tax=Streptomyces sp. OZ13 TaxID=3452210 RepID=UPI003F8B3C66
MEILPRIGVPGARFGRTRASVRAARGAPDSAFRRAADATLTDMYVTAAGGHEDGEGRGAGFFEFLEYDDTGVLHAVEVASPAPVTLDGIVLLGRPKAEVVAELRGLGHEVKAAGDAEGWALPALGVVLGGTAQDADGFESVRLRATAVGDDAFEFFEPTGGSRPAAAGPAEVVAHRGIGPVRLGSARADMRRLLGGGIGSVPEFGGAGQDNFFEAGIVLTYDADETVVRLAFTRPASVGHGGVSLLGRPMSDVRADALARRMRFVEREAELFFPDAGFGVLTARDAPDLPTTAVVLSAGRRGGDPASGEHVEGTGLLW